MILTIDIGNTNITCAFFQNNDIVNIFNIPSDVNADFDYFYQSFLKIISNNLTLSYDINGIVISSVVDELTSTITNVLNQIFSLKPFVITSQLNLGINICLKNKQELGVDRLINAYTAFSLYSKPAIVVDFGTATSFDIIDQHKNFLGGIITPGINIQAKSLNIFTSKLPLVPISFPNKVIGDNTYDAISSGIVRGHAKMIEGLIFEIKKELNNPYFVTIATGGYSQLISSLMNLKFDYVIPNLTLIGLNLIYNDIFSQNYSIPS